MSVNTCFELNDSFDIDTVEFDIVEKCENELDWMKIDHQGRNQQKTLDYMNELIEDDDFDLYIEEFNKKNVNYYKRIANDEMSVGRVLFA